MAFYGKLYNFHEIVEIFFNDEFQEILKTIGYLKGLRFKLLRFWRNFIL